MTVLTNIASCLRTGTFPAVTFPKTRDTAGRPTLERSEVASMFGADLRKATLDLRALTVGVPSEGATA